MKRIGFILLFVILASTSFSQLCANFHLVSSGETLYSISRKYNLTIAEIQSLNPGLVTTVKLGEHICLPNSVKPVQPENKEEPAAATASPSISDLKTPQPISKKDAYAIALLLPFK